MAAASLEAFGVENLRCLTDTGLLPIKPLTLLVGRNSSGKSTFLRAFPLLRQSVQSPRRSPILWSHPSYVDFGSLETAVNERARDRGVTFSFAVRSSEPAFAGGPRCELAMTLDAAEGGVYVRTYDLDVAGQAVHVAFNSDRRVTRLTIDGRDSLPASGLWLSGAAALIASFGADEKKPLSYPAYVGEPPPIEGDGDALAGAPLLERLPRLLAAFDRTVAGFADRVAYLGPRRATGERQYLRSETVVDEILPRGENLPQLLASLGDQEMAGFAAFTRRHLGFETKLRGQGLNIEILIRQRGASAFQNIADVGFGYAEVLPLCATLWLNTGRLFPTSLLALEQPELHLHPAHQARLARMLAGAVKDSHEPGYPTSLLVETHSEALVNGVGMLVREKQIDPADVQIVIFEQDPESRETRLRIAGYKESGALHDWPFGFLAPVADPLDEPTDAAAEE